MIVSRKTWTLSQPLQKTARPQATILSALIRFQATQGSFKSRHIAAFALGAGAGLSILAWAQLIKQFEQNAKNDQRVMEGLIILATKC